MATGEKEMNGNQPGAGPGEQQPTRHGRERAAGVLVADDEEMVRRVLGHFLRKHGFAVWSAADGHAAADLYRRNCDRIDLVLLDVRMPELDGPGTLARLRAINPDVCCWFMSGATGPYNHAELLGRGAARILDKPFVLAELLGQIRQLTARPA
jgi:two-component system OmpR family response regulator